MGQKIHPLSFKLGITKDWPVRWFLKGDYQKFLQEDEVIRRVIRDKISQAGIVAVEIDRTLNNLRITIRAARPGLVIGRGGKGIEELTRALERALALLSSPSKKGGRNRTGLSVNVEELKRSEISAPYVAQQIAWDLEKRLPFRRTMKKYLQQLAQSKEVKGAKILLAGRLDGRDIARKEWLKHGALPLQTLRADIDYGQATAFTTYGTVGVKVWIYKGEIFKGQESSNERYTKRR